MAGAARLWEITRAARLETALRAGSLSEDDVSLAKKHADAELPRIKEELDSYARYDCSIRDRRRREREHAPAAQSSASDGPPPLIDYTGAIAPRTNPAGNATLPFPVPSTVRASPMHYAKAFVAALLAEEDMDGIRILVCYAEHLPLDPTLSTRPQFTLNFDWCPQSVRANDTEAARAESMRERDRQGFGLG
jgi:hypothetical protein